MPGRFVFTIAATMVAWHLALAELYSNAGHFTNSPANGTIHDYSRNNIYPVGTQQTIIWETDWDFVSLVLYQDNNASFQYLQGSGEAARFGKHSI